MYAFNITHLRVIGCRAIMHIPKEMGKALSSNDSEKNGNEWRSFFFNRVWALVTLSAGRKAIANKWVFNAKVDEN